MIGHIGHKAICNIIALTTSNDIQYKVLIHMKQHDKCRQQDVNCKIRAGRTCAARTESYLNY